MFKNAMIAAAALALTTVPGVANAGKFSDKIHLLQKLQNAKKEQLLQLKVDFKTGNSNLTRAEYRAKLAQLQSSLDKIGGRVQNLKDRRASA